ncbi:RdgB/HAM1 family non-canonical purine NTP pyrophosphatase [Pedococcus sp.]|uniref:RdgB/HAM1 family non-canonical purine NTP pyrophosphatase n=1 Tax=Pedococcus sp. TaxID=2860345 RepID=UPI002E0F8EAB|nr:RdgB/HAM1 family non-canonical purine NTP pyrophosphatase [Pedococcus sp.]
MTRETTRLVLATRNDHKVVELRAILADVSAELGLEIVGASEFAGAPDVVEDEVTFEGNARLKAQALAAHTGLPALADDSGLAVDVLGGAPGIFSARWAGRHGDDRANLELLLAQLSDVRDGHRGAAFVCAAVLALPDGTVRATEGRMPGSLAREPKGVNGFGYDPVLVVEGGTRHAAELTAEEKNAISHRGKAFRAMVPHLRDLLG